MIVKTQGSIDDVGNGYNVWIDLTDPTNEEVMALANKFVLDPIALETYFNKSKKPEIRVLDNHTFTVILDMKNKDPETLETQGIYMFLSRHWLITAHNSEINLICSMVLSLAIRKSMKSKGFGRVLARLSSRKNSSVQVSIQSI